MFEISVAVYAVFAVQPTNPDETGGAPTLKPPGTGDVGHKRLREVRQPHSTVSELTGYIIWKSSLATTTIASVSQKG